MISLKRHSVMSLELASRCGWIDRHPRELFIRQPSTGSAFDFRAQPFDQLRGAFVRIHGMAAQTGTIAAMQSLTWRRKKIDILARRFFGRARWSAENSCRADADKKNAFKTRVAIHQRA